MEKGVCTLYDRFDKLEVEKKEKIINAGLSVFGEYGYDKASIDKIVELADISKGSLFYYFESKKNFFLFLYDYCARYMEQLAYSNEMNFMNYTDFFERLKKIELIKAELTIKYPYMYSFMMKAYAESASAVQDGIQQLNSKYGKQNVSRYLENLDYYKFKDGIDPAMVLQLVIWVSNGCMEQLLMKRKIKNQEVTTSIDELNEAFQIFDSYMDLLQQNFYNEEYCN